MKRFLLTAWAFVLTAAVVFAQNEVEKPSIQVAPTSSQQSAVAAPMQPQLPAYMEEAQNMETTRVEWDEVVHDFGEIIEGEVAKHRYVFTNTGNHPVKLTRVKPSCGCTAPSYSQGEIAPGDSGYVDIAFNSRGKLGMQNKAVTVTGNFEGTNMILRFKGEVVRADTAPIGTANPE